MKRAILFWFIAISYVQSELPPSCESPIYCYGELLHAVQMARIFNDGKHFVDLKMRNNENQTLLNFQVLQKKYNYDVPTSDLLLFVDENFEDGNELESYNSTALNMSPPFLKEITNETVQSFAKDLLKIWPQLVRRVRAEVINDPSSYSFLPVPNPFIIPGGRFREYYYWDSYWIIDGLLISGMNEMARGMIDNFISVVKEIGFIPNGGRIYYLKRSHPPLLTFMAHLYYHQTKNLTWLKQNIETLAQELEFWNSRSVQVQRGERIYTLFQYKAVSKGPRPESYREDFLTASFFNDTAQQLQAYVNLKSGAESGWDFSNRWIFDQFGGNLANLSHIETTRLIPVDLNAFLCGAFRNIAELYTVLGNSSQSSIWYNRFVEIRAATANILWNRRDNIWYDYDLKLFKHRRKFYPSNLAPLWAKCFQRQKGHKLGRHAVEYLRKECVLNYAGGVPSSLDNTGEQWDFPNAWAPLQDIVVRGLHNTKYPPALRVASTLAKKWVNSNMLAFQSTGAMFEKYDAGVAGKYGGGGEYEVQSGFGWSNGVALRFIYNYYREL